MTTQSKPLTEAQLQAQLWKIAWNEFPQSRRHIWAVPNGAKRSIYEQNEAKATGLLAGVWDLHCFYKGQFYVFELKVGKNKQSNDQIVWGLLMKNHGAICFEIRENDVERWKTILDGIFNT